MVYEFLLKVTKKTYYSCSSGELRYYKKASGDGPQASGKPSPTIRNSCLTPDT